MIPGRPILYLSLPGLAIVVGLALLYRRKKSEKNFKTKKSDTEYDKMPTTVSDNNCEKQSNSLKIPNNTTKGENNNGNNLGKSAPINIRGSFKTSPIYMPDKQIDTEALKMKICDTELKTLCSIDETIESISSEDLPESIDRNKFHFGQRVHVDPVEEPVVVTATNTAKISPKNSFKENEYTATCALDDINRPLTIITELTTRNEAIKVDHIDNLKNNCINITEAHTHTSLQPNQRQNDVNCENNDTKITSEITEEKIESNQSNLLQQRISSPPLSLCSNQSGDSGKGSSPPHSEAVPVINYEFLVPNTLAGLLIGPKGSYVKEIKSQTGTSVVIKRHPSSNKIRICLLKGTKNEVTAALKMIRSRFPERCFPCFSLQRFNFAVSQSIVPLTTADQSCLKLELIEGINNDVTVCSIISGGHIFVQQPLHPSHLSLNKMQQYLNQSYSNFDAPLLPAATINAICVANFDKNWYRVQIVNYNEEMKSCVVKFIDFGGYASIELSNLRQIRADFMRIPFQATECLLSNIRPIDSEWTSESTNSLYQLTCGIILQAQVAGYNTELNLPEIYLYACITPNNVIFINQELVARKLARWVAEEELIV